MHKTDAPLSNRAFVPHLSVSLPLGYRAGAGMRGNVSIEPLPERNLIRLSFEGRVTAADMDKGEATLAAALKALRPGFALLTDFTDLESMELDCMPAIERTLNLMTANRVALVVRVIPDPARDIGMNILSLFHYPQGQRIITVQTREEAGEILKQER